MNMEKERGITITTEQVNEVLADVNSSISLWMEGYAATGERGVAQCLGNYNAKTIDEAVKEYMEKHPNSVDWDRYGRGRHAIWACEIFDNERDARKSFG
jgi:hypothetical protein